jgi:PhnB protein
MAKAIPEGLHTVTPQLIVDGAQEAIAFYAKAFGAEEKNRAVDPSGRKVLHTELRIGDSVIFLNDAMPEMGAGAEKAHLWIYTSEADALFDRAVAAGATVLFPMTDQFWGDRTGTVADRWGIRWNLARRVKDLTPAQMKQAQDEWMKSWKPPAKAK